MSNYVHKDDCKIEVKFSKFSAWFSKNGAIRQNTLHSFSSSVHVEFMFIKMTPRSKFLLAHLKMAQLVKIPFIVFHLARLIFTGQTSH